MINLLTLFTGGLSSIDFALKYEKLEYKHIAACEIDKYARKQFLKFHNSVEDEFYNDVSTMSGVKYKDKIDLMVWGSPCQDLSLAGNREGFKGKKSSLFREGARIMSEIMPKKFIFENVKGLLSSNNGNDYKEVIKTFQGLGYFIAMKVLNAKDYGTAQNRERVFIVGFLDSDEYHKFHFENKTKLEKKVRDYLEDAVDEKYYLSDKMLKLFERKKDYKIQAFHDKNDTHINCLTARYYKMGITDPYIKEPYLEQVGNIDTKGNNSLWGRVYDTKGLAPTLNANGGGAGAKTGLFYIKSATKVGYEIATSEDTINFTHIDSKTRRGRVGKGIAQTLDCACNQAIIENTTKEFRIRKLTPVEAFKLMGVKSEDIELVNSDTQNYSIAGNGIEVNTLRSIVRAMYKNEKPKDTLF